MSLRRRALLAGRLLIFSAWMPAAFASNAPAPTPSQNSSGGAVVQFTYVNQKLQPARYSITVQENGSAHYRSERGPAKDDSRFPAQPQDRPITISPPVLHEIFAAARQAKYFAIRCENGGKNLAFQGTKTLEYTGSKAHEICTYNWSNDKQIQKLTSIFEGISFTLVEGDKLRVEDMYFKLALDDEMQALVASAKEGDALEIQNIDPILRTIANDSQNLDRVRRDARQLLSPGGAKSESQASGN